MFNNNIKRDWSAKSSMPYDFNQETGKEHLSYLSGRLEKLNDRQAQLEKNLNAKNKLKRDLNSKFGSVSRKKINPEIKRLDAEIDKLKLTLHKLEERINSLESYIDSLNYDIGIDETLERIGYFGASALGKCISGVVQTAAIPFFAGLQVATRYPFASACVVLGIQVYGATAEVVLDSQKIGATRIDMVNADKASNANAATLPHTTSAPSFKKMSPRAKFHLVKDACEIEGKGIDCADRIIKLSRSANPLQAGNATEYLAENAANFSKGYEEEILKLEGVRISLNKFKPAPIRPKPNQCESTHYTEGVGYLLLKECVTPLIERSDFELDSDCMLLNQCPDGVELTFQGQTKILQSGHTLPCFKAGIFYRDIEFQKQGNPTQKIIRTAVQTAYSAATCNLEGKYKPEHTIISRIDPKPIPTKKPTSKPDTPLIVNLKEECLGASPLNCAIKVSEVLTQHSDNSGLKLYTTQNFETFITPINKEISRLEKQYNFLDENYLSPAFEQAKALCDETAVEFDAFCVDNLVKLSYSNNEAKADSAKKYIVMYGDKFTAGIKKRISALSSQLGKIEKCEPEPSKPTPNACESTEFNEASETFKPLAQCISVRFKKPYDPRGNLDDDCQYINECLDTVHIYPPNSEGMRFTLSHKETWDECMETNRAIECNLDGKYDKDVPRIARYTRNNAQFPSTTLVSIAPQLERLKQNCATQPHLACAESAVNLVKETNNHPQACAYVNENIIKFERAIDNQLIKLDEYRHENKELFESAITYGKCESAKPFTRLQDCIRPIFDCDEMGDNKCDYLNECPEDLILTKNFQSKTIKSGEKVSCFELGSYTDLDGVGELVEFKEFAGVYCSTTGEEDDPENINKVYVSKMNEQ